LCVLVNYSYNLHAPTSNTAPHRCLGGTLAARLLGNGAPLEAVVVPQSADNLSGDHLAHVDADQPDDEHAVASEIVLGELGQYAGLALRRVERAQLLAEVLDVSGPVQRSEQPAHEVDRGDGGHEHEPEPDEEEDFLVEQVDRQSTRRRPNPDTSKRLIVSAHWTTY